MSARNSPELIRELATPTTYRNKNPRPRGGVLFLELPTNLKILNVGFWPFSAIGGSVLGIDLVTANRSKAAIPHVARRYSANDPNLTLTKTGQPLPIATRPARF